MNRKKIKNKIINATSRDINLSRKTFSYLFFTLLAIVLIVEVIILKGIIFKTTHIPSEIEVIIALTIIAISFLISGVVIDKIHNRTQFYNIAYLICLVGLIFIGIPILIFEYIGLVITLISLTFMTCIWFTILIHETNILNRGRITAYLLMFCFALGSFGFIFAVNEIFFIFFIITEFILFVGIFKHSKNYTYIETTERLKSKENFKQIIFEKHFFRYSSSFTILSFILGNLLAWYGFNIEIFTFFIATFLYTIAAGIFLDNIGRKTSIVVGILVLSFFLISYGSYTESEFIFGMPRLIFFSFHYAFSLAPLLLAVFTVSGDFSTERQNLKYRGRINGLFMSLIFFGIVLGFLFSRLLTTLYLNFPILDVYIPNLPEYLNAFILVIILVWMMGMKEFLMSKERRWAEYLNYLYVFNTESGVCLYSYNFSEEKTEDVEKIANIEIGMDDDLISGALSGILTIVSEITKSKKQLRKIVKEGKYVYFSHGKNHVVSLISSMDLPILLKKLDKFSKEFEEKFDENINDFGVNMSVFKDGEFLVEKYFKEKHSFFID